MLTMRARRKNFRLTQSEVAEIIGTTQVTIGRWERGEASPSVDKLKVLAKLYRCTVDELIDDVGKAEGSA